MRTHLSSVAEENKLFDGSGNVGVCENPQTGAGVGAVAGADKKAGVCESSLRQMSGKLNPQPSLDINGHQNNKNHSLLEPMTGDADAP